MNDRVNGGDDADLELLRRTSPRRAARLEAMRAEAAREQVLGHGAQPAPAAYRPPPPPAWAPDAYVPVLPHQHPEEHVPVPPQQHPEAVEPEPPHRQPEAYEPVPAEPAWHPFGDPVADGYIAPAPAVIAPRRRRRGASLLALLVVLGILGGAGWFAYVGLRPVLGDLAAFELFAAPEDYEGAGTGTVEVVVSPGDTGTQMARTLSEADVVASADAFLAAANAEPEFTSIQPGRYTLRLQIPATEAVAGLLDPANRVTGTVVIAEGLRLEQILQRTAEQTGIPLAELEAAVAVAALPPAAQGNPEGFLYPDGYQLGDDPSADEVVAAMIQRGQEVLTELGVAPEDQLTVLTKASLVQGEARLDEDFGRVARVVENRLAVGQPLELDSTVNYATQTFDTRTTAQQRDSDSPYNTYRVTGLPPGPIKAPGRQAIEAVVAPTPGPWLYFVSIDLCTGQTVFAETFAEHEANVQLLNAWQRENTAEDGSLVCG